MRLLNTRTGRFHWFEDPRHVRYAILSHVWSKDKHNPEKTYQDVLRFESEVPEGEPILSKLSSKLRRFCEVSHENGFEFGWADSCCIDKTSSSELSEAITSMYDWYRYAAVCYAFLHDVRKDPEFWRGDFCNSEWFTRGWTLQELLAPTILLFFSQSWDVLGSKQTLAILIQEVTTIDHAVLTFERSLEEVSIARKMSWAASRRTSREEDEAYSLMGIFGVSIPITYGEGRYAYVRLQEEIIRVVPDQSIFGWGPVLTRHRFQFASPDADAAASMPQPPSIELPPTTRQYLLASCPKDFEESSALIHLSREAFAKRLEITPEDAYQVFSVTAYGMHTRLPLIAVVSQDSHDIVPTHLALLACEVQTDGRLLALLLRPRVHQSGTGFSVGTLVGKMTDLVTANAFGSTDPLSDYYYRATFLSLQEIQQCLRRHLFRMASVYIPHWPSRIANEQQRDEPTHTTLRDARDSFEVRLADWSRMLLSLQGYRVSPMKSEDSQEPDIALHNRVLNLTLLPGLVIVKDGVRIDIQVGRCKCNFGKRLLGVLIWSRDATCSLEQQFAEDRHLVNHPVHIHSWDFRGGIASTRIHLNPHTLPNQRITLRMTFCHSPMTTTNARVKAYQLGVEITVSEEVDPTRLLEAEAAMGRRLDDTAAGTFPVRQPTQYHANAASVFLTPPKSPPALQRTRSNSAPYAHRFDPYLENRPSENLTSQYAGAGDHVGESPSNIAHRAPSKQESGPLPSPPLTAENSRSSDSVPQVPYWQRSAERRQSERHDLNHGQAYVARGEQRCPPTTHGPVSPTAPKTPNHRLSLWIPTTQPAGWVQLRTPQLERSRSLGDESNPTHIPESGLLHGSTRDDSYVVQRNMLSSGQPPIRPTPRSKSSDEGRYQTGSGEVTGGMPVPHVSNSFYYGQGDILGGTHVPNFVRSESPDQLMTGEVIALEGSAAKSDNRYYNHRHSLSYSGGALPSLQPPSAHQAPRQPGNVELNPVRERQPARGWTGAGDGQSQPRPDMWSSGSASQASVEGWSKTVTQQRRPPASVLQSPGDIARPFVVQPPVMGDAPSDRPPPQITLTSPTPPLSRAVLPPAENTAVGTGSGLGDARTSMRSKDPQGSPREMVIDDGERRIDDEQKSGRGGGVKRMRRALGSFFRRDRS